MPRSIVILSLALTACTGPDPALLCRGSAGPCAAVGTTSDDGASGALAIVDVGAATSTLDLTTLDADTRMHVHGGELYVLSRTSGVLRIYDPHTLAVKIELPLGDSSHPAATAAPRDFWVDDEHGEIWVSLAGNVAQASLAIVDRDKPGTVLYLGLPQDAADPDGKPEPDLLYHCNSKLYVTLDSRSADVTGAVRYGRARMAIVDPDKRTVLGVIPLSGTHLADLTRVGDDCNDVVVAEASSPNTAFDGSGAVERLDLDRAFSKGVLATDAVLGGKPTLVATHGFGELFIGLEGGRVAHFDLKNTALKTDVASGFGAVTFLRTYGSRLLVGAGPGGAQGRGLYVGPVDGTPLTGSPIDVGATPTSVTLP